MGEGQQCPVNRVAGQNPGKTNNQEVVMYYTFTGQNASTGTPNPTTGRMSFYGTVRKWNNKQNAVDYAEKHDTGYTDCISVAGTKSTIRNYCLGSTVENFELDIREMPTED